MVSGSTSAILRRLFVLSVRLQSEGLFDRLFNLHASRSEIVEYAV